MAKIKGGSGGQGFGKPEVAKTEVAKDLKTQLEEAQNELAKIQAETARVKEANDKKQKEVDKMKLNIFVENNNNRK